VIQIRCGTDVPCTIITGKPTHSGNGKHPSWQGQKSSGCGDLILLKFTSTYPATPENTNISNISYMCELFGCEVGLSDHTMGVGVAVAAVVFGATVIEKHFTLSRANGGVDSVFSREPHELKTLVTESECAWLALGKVSYSPTQTEQNSRLRRRSLYIGENMESGDVLTELNLRRVRPGEGLAPKFYDVLLGKKVTKKLKKGTPVSRDILDASADHIFRKDGNICSTIRK